MQSAKICTLRWVCPRKLSGFGIVQTVDLRQVSAMPFDPRRELSLCLDDGTPLCVRSIRPEDRDFIAEAFRRLSPESRYFRFWTRVRELNPKLVDEICNPDQKDHVAWVAVHQTRDDIPGIGGGSFWRLKDDPKTAEVSFTVADEFQGRGMGTLLLAVLWEHALTLGITRLVGHVLHENITMRAWWDALGAMEQEAPRHWITTLILDESLIENTPAGKNLLSCLAMVRELMNGENTLKD